MEQRFQEIENLFSVIVEEMSQLMDQPSKDELSEFIDHGEYGLALETLCYVLRGNRISLSSISYSKIKKLVEMLGFDNIVLDGILVRKLSI